MSLLDDMQMHYFGIGAIALPWRMVTRSSGVETALVGGLVLTLGVVVLAGWAFDVATLKSPVPGWVAIKANTAIAFVLTGLGLVLLARPDSTKASAWSVRIRKPAGGVGPDGRAEGFQGVHARPWRRGRVWPVEVEERRHDRSGTDERHARFPFIH